MELDDRINSSWNRRFCSFSSSQPKGIVADGPITTRITINGSKETHLSLSLFAFFWVLDDGSLASRLNIMRRERSAYLSLEYEQGLQKAQLPTSFSSLEEENHQHEIGTRLREFSTRSWEGRLKMLRYNLRIIGRKRQNRQQHLSAHVCVGDKRSLLLWRGVPFSDFRNYHSSEIMLQRQPLTWLFLEELCWGESENHTSHWNEWCSTKVIIALKIFELCQSSDQWSKFANFHQQRISTDVE